MRPARTQVYLLPSERPFLNAFQSGVSLHGHTEHSREGLGKLPQYLERMPVVAQFTRWEMERYRAANGETPDFSRAYWRGPVTAQAAYELELRQIETLGLLAMVSLTDHDNLDAGLLLRNENPTADIPISVEWTVPYENASFHLGIHNIAPDYARSWITRIADCTRLPQSELLGALLEELDSAPNILVVLNHPLWDIGGVGSSEIVPFVRRFLKAHGRYIHALEINGLRSWAENLGVVSVAQACNCPVVSGGDRHGFEPNATINITCATSFADFVHEIREERTSDIVMMPHYREPLVLRHLLTAWDIVREHPQLAGRRHWPSRVVVRCDDGIERPLSDLWTEGAPAWINPCLKMIGLLANPSLRVPFRLAYPVTGSTVL